VMSLPMLISLKGLPSCVRVAFKDTQAGQLSFV
jgi:hypothetical protein